MIFHTLSFDLWPIRVHEFFAREICLLQSKNPSLWVRTSLNAAIASGTLEHPRTKKRGRKRWRNAPGLFGSHFGARTIAEESDAAHWPYAASHGTPLAPRPCGGLCWELGFCACQQAFLVLLLDGLYFRFRGKDWVLYVMAVKPCRQNRAVFLDPVSSCQGERTCRAGLRYSQPFPPPYTDASGPRSPTRFPELSGSAQARAGSCSSAISISSADCSNAGADAIASTMADPCAKRFTNMSAKLSSCPMAPGCKPCSKNSGILFGRQKACASCA